MWEIRFYAYWWLEFEEESSIKVKGKMDVFWGENGNILGKIYNNEKL